MREKIVLIGAGSAVFTRGLVYDLICKRESIELGLVDINPEALEVAERLTFKMIQKGRADIKLRASVDRCDVLKDATVVICTIGVGGRRGWEKDVFIPRKYGIYQAVGDTVGPGGSSRAVRMIPAMVKIAEDVIELAPNALFFNYANPMACICRAVRKASGADIIGLCHGVIGTIRSLAKDPRDTELLNLPLNELSYDVAGINHLTWIMNIKHKGKDITDRLKEIADVKLSKLKDGEDPEKVHPFQWELVKLFGAFPAPGDRHITEFFPSMFKREGSYYGKTLGVDAYRFEGYIEAGDKIYAQMQEDAYSSSPLADEYFEQFSGEHEQVVDIIDSVRRDAGRIYSANLPNEDRIRNLPPDAIVEILVSARKEGLIPIGNVSLPAELAGVLASRFMWVETIVEAGLKGDMEKFVWGLVLDGYVDSLKQAWELGSELIEAHRENLPQFKERGDDEDRKD